MKRRYYLLITFVAILAAGYFACPYILQGAATRLVVRDKLEKADVIVVLGGDGNGERVTEAVKLYRQGLAKRMMMSGGPLNWHLTYAEWMKKQAAELGVPAGVIMLEDESRSTIENAEFSLPLIKEKGYWSIILVTSPPHTRRAARVFRKVFSRAGIKVMVQPAEKSEFDPVRWWTRHEDTGLVVWEYVSSVLYFFKGY